MALLHADSYGFYDAATQIGRVYNTVHGPSLSPHALGGTLVSATNGPDGTPSIQFSGDSADGITRALSPGDATFACFTYFKASALPSANVVIGPILSGACQCSVVLNSSTFQVYRGTAGGTLLGSVSYTYTAGTLIGIAFKVLLDASAGTVDVKIYESSDWTTAVATLSLTGQNTQAGASATYDSYELSAACTGTTDFAGTVIMDGTGSTLNGLIAPPSVFTLFASNRSAGSLTDWTLSTGSDPAALLDDATPDDDTTYAGTSTQNQQESVYVDLLTHPNRPVLGMELFACLKLTSGTPTVTPIARQSGTVYAGSSFSPTSSYTYAAQPYSAMPDGTAFSTAGRIDALQWGAKLTSSSSGVRLTQVAVVVVQQRTANVSQRPHLFGEGHEVTGDDVLIGGQSNTVTGTASEAHGVNTSVTGDRSVAFGLDGNVNALAEDGKMKVFGKFDVTDLAQLLGGLKVLTSDPSSPADGAAWLFDDGGSPRSLSIRWRTGGTTYDLPIGTATT